MNLLACCVILSSTGFMSYLLSFYSKYFKGDFYVNFAAQGGSDVLGIWYMKLLSILMKSIQKHVNILIC